MNWTILILKGHKTLKCLGEGPFKTKREAMLFANCEVYGDWYVTKLKPISKKGQL